MCDADLLLSIEFFSPVGAAFSICNILFIFSCSAGNSDVLFKPTRRSFSAAHVSASQSGYAPFSFIPSSTCVFSSVKILFTVARDSGVICCVTLDKSASDIAAN